MFSWVIQNQFILIILIHVQIIFCHLQKNVIELTENTWKEVLHEEWLLEFYAPWCPACRQMEDTWRKVGTWQEDLNIKVAKLDISEHASLSGRFLITSLPTIYHVKDGDFRQYTGPRDENSIVTFVDESKWKEIDPVQWYFHPNTIHMSSIGYFFTLSLAIRDMHNQMTTEYGIPTWGSYLIFSLMTIFLGLVFGLCIVCCCDYCCLSAPKRVEPQRYSLAHADGRYRVPSQDNDPAETDDKIEEPHIRRRKPEDNIKTSDS